MHTNSSTILTYSKMQKVDVTVETTDRFEFSEKRMECRMRSPENGIVQFQLSAECSLLLEGGGLNPI